MPRPSGRSSSASLYAGLAASFCMLVGILVAYIVERRLVRGASLIAALVTIPIIIPGIVLSVGFFSAYTRPPLNFYGTATIIVAAFVATFLPIAYSQAGSILKGISPDLERAARSVVASEGRNLRVHHDPALRGAWWPVGCSSSFPSCGNCRSRSSSSRQRPM